MFFNRLTKEQVEGFIKRRGIIADVEWLPKTGEIILYHGADKKKTILSVTDKKITAPHEIFDIFDGDWQVFMRSIFGDEYMKAIGLKDVENEFVDKLKTSEDILYLVPFTCLYHFEPRESVQKGTKRFIIRKEFDGYKEELIVGPLHSIGTVRFYGVNEHDFHKRMHVIFGEDYDKWCESHADLLT